MRIVLFTVDDLEFAPMLNQPLIDKCRDNIVAAYVSKSLFSFKKLRKRVGFFIKNGYPFCIKPSDILKYACWRYDLKRKGFKGCSNVVSYLTSQGIKASYIEEISSEETHQLLKTHDADIFLFAPFDKIAGEKFLSIPKLGTFNVHLGKLPEYRGGLSAFWVLRFGDKEAGITMHRAVPQIDGGELVAEFRFPVNTHSMYELMKETVQHASQIIVRGIEMAEAGNLQAINTVGRGQGYYLWPERHDFEEFYAKENRLI